MDLGIDWSTGHQWLVMVNVNGEPVPAENMRCTPVTGSLADFNKACPNWRKGNFYAAVWGQARVRIFYVNCSS